MERFKLYSPPLHPSIRGRAENKEKENMRAMHIQR